ncbi:DUF222 domain-containing protein [Dactylosporangium sp. NPDC048998]|uniref:HNH endonuclease signature motif containing protein n=1 Tax=Dactylosporangium sp. NPDC048998 TaxID=3363976 RepID=UPI0037226639
MADTNTPAEEQYRRRGVTLTRLGDMWRLRGVLDTETGALFSTTLDAFTKPPGQGDDRSPAQRRHDATADMLNTVLRSGQAPEIAGGRPSIGLLMPVHRYLRLHDHSSTDTQQTPRHHSPHHTDTGDHITASPDNGSPDNGDHDNGDHDGPAVMAGWGPVSDTLAARLSCDATLQQLWLHPENGIPLQLGRAYRNTPPPLRRALAARDPYCRWPGCRIPANWCDSHHLRQWIRDHGETNIDNLVLLCRYHHVCMHERGWQLLREPHTGWIRIIRPDGRRYELGPSQPRVDETPPHKPGRHPPPEHHHGHDTPTARPPGPPATLTSTPDVATSAASQAAMSSAAGPQAVASPAVASSPTGPSAAALPPAGPPVARPRATPTAPSTAPGATSAAPVAPPNVASNRSHPGRAGSARREREEHRRVSRETP